MVPLLHWQHGERELQRMRDLNMESACEAVGRVGGRTEVLRVREEECGYWRVDASLERTRGAR